MPGFESNEPCAFLIECWSACRRSVTKETTVVDDDEQRLQSQGWWPLHLLQTGWSCLQERERAEGRRFEMKQEIN